MLTQALRRDQNHFVFAVGETLQAFILFGGGEGRVDEGGGDVAFDQAINLIFHQRDEGRDDEGGAVEAERGELIDERLARAGGHDDQRIASF